MTKTEQARTTAYETGCPSCGAPVMATRNPFYGIDLAVHKYVRTCLECSWLNFASDTKPAKAEENWAPTRSPGSLLLGILGRIYAAPGNRTAA